MWSTNAYSITYDANGGTGVPGNNSANFGDPVSVDFSVTPTKLGHTFQGWEDRESGKTYTSAGQNSFSMPARNVTLYAVWEKKLTQSRIT